MDEIHKGKQLKKIDTDAMKKGALPEISAADTGGLAASLAAAMAARRGAVARDDDGNDDDDEWVRIRRVLAVVCGISYIALFPQSE